MDIMALAKQYVREYKSTPEFGNWDTVIELGKQLADAIIAGAHIATAGTEQTNPLPNYVARPAEYIGGLSKGEKKLIEDDQFLRAVKAVRERLNCGLVQAKEICDGYRKFLAVARVRYPEVGKPHRADCGGCLECSPTPRKKL